MKKTAASTPVVLLRKFAEPLAPNKLPDEPLPKAAPMSAPFPCWSRTRTMTVTADRTCNTQTSVSKAYSKNELVFCRAADCNELIRNKRSAANQASIDVRHGE